MANEGQVIPAVVIPVEDPAGNVNIPKRSALKCFAVRNLFFAAWTSMLTFFTHQSQICWFFLTDLCTASRVFIAGQYNLFHAAVTGFVELWRSIVVFFVNQGNLWRTLGLNVYGAFTVFVGRQWMLIYDAFMIAFGWLSTKVFNINNWVREKIAGEDKNKLFFTYRELSMLAPTVINAVFTITAIDYPGETTNAKRTVGFFLFGLSFFYFLSHYLRVLIDKDDDRATFFFYVATNTDGSMVFYHKAVQHIVGYIVITLSVVVSYIQCSIGATWFAYYLTVASGILGVLYAMIQVYRTDTTPCIAEDSEEGPTSTPIQVSPRFPPRGRCLWYEKVLDAED